MILRRIGRKLREQDWFAVVVEIFAVVFGVFLGLQVSSWNDERQERRDEHQILERLHEESASLLQVVQEERASLQSRETAIVSAQPVIFSLEPARPLTQSECNAIWNSHIFRMASDELPVLDELIATGRFDRLRDGALKQQLRDYLRFRERQRNDHAERTNELFRLHSRHPEAVYAALLPESDEYEPQWNILSDEDSEWGLRCDVEEMRESQSFQNELFDNIGRYSTVLLTYQEREQVLVELNERLESLMND